MNLKYTVEADLEYLIKRASMTTEDYFFSAVKIIDEQFEKGYAKDHPELVGQMVQAAAMDYQATMTLIAADSQSNSLSSICAALAEGK